MNQFIDQVEELAKKRNYDMWVVTVSPLRVKVKIKTYFQSYRFDSLGCYYLVIAVGYGNKKAANEGLNMIRDRLEKNFKTMADEVMYLGSEDEDTNS